MRAWIYHLAGGKPVHLLAEDGHYSFAPAPGSETLLRELAAIYLRGQNIAVHFFPKSSYAYVKTKDEPWRAARKAWLGSEHGDFARGESDDLYCRLAYKHVDPLDADFEKLARQVYEPLRAALQELP